MELLAAALLGIVQGFTEFLPISSSAHLILIPWLFGWNPEGLAFDVSLHLGTALAILAYFWKDWVLLAREALAGVLSGDVFGNPQRKLAWLVVVATIPGAVIGKLFEARVEQSLRSPLVTVFTLAGLAIVLYIADRRSANSRPLESFGWSDSILIGLSQAIALIPGVSRSGITISAALFRDAERAAAARFSFLLATPIIVGAALETGWSLLHTLTAPAAAGIKWDVFAVGMICAAVTGFLCIRFFMHYLRTRTFLPFVIYRILLAGIVLFFYLRHL